MKGILTVIGKDKVGIISTISKELERLNINILDVNQTIMQSNFTMFMVVDLEKSTYDFETIKKSLLDRGNELNVYVKIQREEIFNSMHKI